MVYIIATILRKALEKHDKIIEEHDLENLWKRLMLTPYDYSAEAIVNPVTKKLMEKIEFQHGGKDYDDKYPEGIPTSISIKTKATENAYDSGLIMFPGGHSKNDTVSLYEIMQHKFSLLGKIALKKADFVNFKTKLENIDSMTNEELQDIYDCNIQITDAPIDDTRSLL